MQFTRILLFLRGIISHVVAFSRSTKEGVPLDDVSGFLVTPCLVPDSVRTREVSLQALRVFDFHCLWMCFLFGWLA